VSHEVLKLPGGCREAAGKEAHSQHNAFLPHPNIQHLHANREGHSSVDVSFRDVDVEAFHHKHEANHDEEGKCQHFDCGMPFDEVRNRLRTNLHHDHRNNHGDNHDE